MDSTQQRGVILATQAVVFALTCVLFVPLRSMTSELQWESYILPDVHYFLSLARVVSQHGHWLLLALLLIGHVAPLVINRWRPNEHAVGIQMTCSAVQVIGLFTMWVLLASEIGMRIMPIESARRSDPSSAASQHAVCECADAIE
jgi:hypothetical protein